MASFPQAPLTIQSNAPLELVHQLFVKLGARYVIVTDTEGYCMSILLHMTLGFVANL
jgi:chloride channel 3/4/5